METRQNYQQKFQIVNDCDDVKTFSGFVKKHYNFLNVNNGKRKENLCASLSFYAFAYFGKMQETSV